jgi:hypothetical protein
MCRNEIFFFSSWRHILGTPLSSLFVAVRTDNFSACRCQNWQLLPKQDYCSTVTHLGFCHRYSFFLFYSVYQNTRMYTGTTYNLTSLPWIWVKMIKLWSLPRESLVLCHPREDYLDFFLFMSWPWSNFFTLSSGNTRIITTEIFYSRFQFMYFMNFS